MIVRILSRGKSFKGLATYLTHDPEAQTNERVAWTRTFNLANDHVPSGVDEMLWTARNAELLKQEAGLRAGGRATENSVKHLSLNWSPDDHPSREHMIATTEGFLRHMNWQDHQAIVVAHDDKAHTHVHVMLNVINPETGLRLDDNFERRRAQAWALNYEREQDRIHCAQRLVNPEERESAPPRNMWLAFQENEKEFGRAEKLLREQKLILVENSKNQRDADWKILKKIQRTERTDFFAQGKLEFSDLRSSIYREVREEFRERWADFYEARRDGANKDTLADLKAGLVAEQKAVLDARRDEACRELRESRDERYRALLDDQREVRAGLRSRQEDGLDTAPFLQQLEQRNTESDTKAEFREAADQVTTPHGSREAVATSITAQQEDEATNRPAGRDDDISLRPGFSVGSFLDSLFFDLVNLGSARPPPRKPGPHEPDSFAAAAAETLKHQQQREREEEEDERLRRQRALYGE